MSARTRLNKPNDARMVHVLIKSTAQEMAGAFYEHAAVKSDAFYEQFPNQDAFVRKEWQKFVLTSKKVLTQMLGLASTPEGQKVQIYEALMADSTLPYSPIETQVVNFPH